MAVTWRSFPALRKEQFALLIGAAKKDGALSDDIVERIVAKRDEREKLLLKNLILQIALFVALIVTPTEAAVIPVFGIPFKAVHETILFLLAILNLLAVFIGMTIKVLNDFLATWLLQKFPSQSHALGTIAYASHFGAHYWCPPPLSPLKRGKLTSIVAFLMTILPIVPYALMFVVGLVATVYVATQVWQSPSLPAIISKSTVVFFISSYVINLFYAIVDTIPLPYKR